MAAFRLNSIENINSALAAFKNNPDVRADKFYSKILEDTIKVPLEDYVHVQHATQTRTLPPGHQSLVLKRMGSWTPHTAVLKEGIPPRPDVTKSESIELGYTQFGRFAYFTDQIRTDLLDDFWAHYVKELGDLANRTIEKFAREKLLSAPSAYLPDGKDSIGSLLPGDIITIADLRLMVKYFERQFVKPIGGKFNYICSPEFMHDLIDDPYVENYMRINQSTFNMYTSEEPFDLFKLKFITTRLDENLAPDIDHPGEFIGSDGIYRLRVISAEGDKVWTFVDGGKGISIKNEENATGTNLNENALAQRFVLTNYYYKDGSAIENRVYWHIDGSKLVGGNIANQYAYIENLYEYNVVSKQYVLKTNHTDVLGEDVIDGYRELPINRGILTGAEGLAKVIVEGQGATQIIIKELGSAGTADPLNQLSSMGFKIQGLGFGFIRPEAVFITYSVPNTAVKMLGLTTNAILGSADSRIGELGNIYKHPTYGDVYVRIGADGLTTIQDANGNIMLVFNPLDLGLDPRTINVNSAVNVLERLGKPGGGVKDFPLGDVHPTQPNIPGPKHWFVEFIAMDGETQLEIPMQYVADKKYAVAPAGIENSAGKAVTGWYKEVELTNAWNFSTDKVKANTKLYAKWAD